MKRLLITLLVIFLIPTLCFAGKIQIAWDANTDDVHGYNVYYGFSSRSYTVKVNVGNVNGCAITGLEDGVKYYISVTAYNDTKESGYSNEVSSFPTVIPPPSPPPPPLPPPPTPPPTLQPDLIITTITCPVSARIGRQFVGQVVVRNVGKAKSTSTTVKFYLSKDKVKSTNDVLITTIDVPPVNSGSSYSKSISITIPVGTATGRYYIIACVDENNLIVESNENNNNTSSTSAVNVTK